MAPSVLITGASSFLATHFIAAAGDALPLVAQRRPDIDGIRSGRFDVVVNFACHPAYYSDDYCAGIDVDRMVADACKEGGAHFFMMSSRLVYGAAEGNRLSEDRAPKPLTTYARNKARTEAHVTDILGDQATVLRLGNVFDMELGRRTFAGLAMTSLRRSGRIVLDIGFDTPRDFLPCTDFAAALARLVPIRPGVVVNLGSGIETRVGDMANWFIEGYGSGDVTATSDEPRDAFCLDTRKLEALIGPATSAASVRENAIDSGRRLRLA